MHRWTLLSCETRRARQSKPKQPRSIHRYIVSVSVDVYCTPHSCVQLRPFFTQSFGFLVFHHSHSVFSSRLRGLWCHANEAIKIEHNENGKKERTGLCSPLGHVFLFPFYISRKWTSLALLSSLTILFPPSKMIITNDYVTLTSLLLTFLCVVSACAGFRFILRPRIIPKRKMMNVLHIQFWLFCCPKTHKHQTNQHTHKHKSTEAVGQLAPSLN